MSLRPNALLSLSLVDSDECDMARSVGGALSPTAEQLLASESFGISSPERLRLTNHGRSRLRQRAIPERAVEVVISFGDVKRKSGADRYFLTKASRERAERALGAHTIRSLEGKLDIIVVMSDEGELITAAHRTKRIKM